MIRIAHFSDIHVLSLQGVTPRDFLNKRATGAVNLAFNRARQYRVEIFERLLETVTALAVDHTVCTGDLVNLALPAEFTRVQALLDATFDEGSLTLVPGNHDYYVEAARGSDDRTLFERTFSKYLPHDLQVSDDIYPITRVLPGIAIVGLSSAVSTPAFFATGNVGLAQLEAARRALGSEEATSRFRLLLIHHPLLSAPGRPLNLMRRLVDADEVKDRLTADPRFRPHLVVHGHNHVFLRESLPGTDTPIIQVAAGSRHRVGHFAEFNVYCVEGDVLVGVERHIYDPRDDRFVAHDEAGRACA